LNKIVDTFIAPLCLEDIEVIHKNESFVLISKPSGLLSLSGKNPLNHDSVHSRLKKLFPTATLVHRLDFGTSGIMIVALNKQVNANITKQFQQGAITKHYKAILEGHLPDDQGIINLPIAKDESIFPRVKIAEQSGKPAITRYIVEHRLTSPDRTVVQFRPTTGRTHQLRIHAEAIGHPILGCDLYGSDISYRLAKRLMLHAESIEFKHPETSVILRTTSVCPF